MKATQEVPDECFLQIVLVSRWFRSNPPSPHPPSRFSVAVCRFPNTGDDWYVLVGVARDMILNPKSVGGGFIYTYRLVSGGEKLEFVHKVGWSGSAGDPGFWCWSTPPLPC